MGTGFWDNKHFTSDREIAKILILLSGTDAYAKMLILRKMKFKV